MKVVRSARLHLRAGTSDKVYEVDLVENDAVPAPERFLVNFRYGRRGAALREGSKTAQPVVREAAERVFDSVVVSKLNGGYSRGGEFAAQSGVAGDGDPGEGRAGILLARLTACRRWAWPEADRERLLWRIGQLRLAAAGPDLVAMAEERGPAAASYALVWALARAGGAPVAALLEAVAAGTPSVVIRDLARFALASPLMGDQRRPAGEAAGLPADIARAAGAGDGAGLAAALAALATQRPAEVGPVLVALGRCAQGDPVLHGGLCAALPVLPARPPFLIGLRRLLKHAEMADDAGLFAAAGRRFETATAMYRSGDSHVYWAKRMIPIREERGTPQARIGLSSATRLYLKRRIWRGLRKRGEVGDPRFTEMAAAFLLGLHPGEMGPRTHVYTWARQPNGSWGRDRRLRGPLSTNWTASQLLYRHAAQARPRPGTLTFYLADEPDPESRDEAFPDLWSARPDLALRLAVEGGIAPVSMLGLRVLRADPAARASLTTADLGHLLEAAWPEVPLLALEIARARLAEGEADPHLLAVLVRAPVAEARTLALRRIEAEPELPWSSPSLAFLLLTSPEREVVEAVAVHARARPLPPAISAPLTERLIAWLRAMPTDLDADAAAAIRAMRAGIPLLWPGGDMPVSESDAVALVAHPVPEVAAAGIALLAQSGVDPDGFPAERWDALLGSDSVDVREAALGLMGRLDAAGLTRHAERVHALAIGGPPPLRRAARPLVRRLVEADPGRAGDLAQAVIAALFRTAPDDAFAADMIALLREAAPGELAGLDAGTLWRLLQARAKGAQRLGAALLAERTPDLLSVRQIARLGGHPHLSVRQWAMGAYAAAPARFQAEAADAVLLVDGDWPDTLAFARAHFATWPEEAWTPAALAAVTDSVKPEVLAFARHLLRTRLRPGDADAQVLRLLEHPSPSMHLLLTELLSEQAVAGEDAFARLVPLARIVMLQVLTGRTAKDRMAAFLKAEALRSRARAERLLPLFADLSLSGTARDRSAALLTLRDLAAAYPDLDTPLVRRAPTARRPPEPRAEGAR